LPNLQFLAQELDRSGDANGFYCPTHSAFKVADTVFAEHWAKDYTRPQWEAALRKAKAENEAGEWPLINSKDFCTLHFNLFPWVPFTERTTGSANRMMLVGMEIPSPNIAVTVVTAISDDQCFPISDALSSPVVHHSR